MAPETVRGVQRRQPFEAFRIRMVDGTGYDIRHPELVWVGRRSAHIGLTGDPDQTLFERYVRVDLAHIVELTPLG